MATYTQTLEQYINSGDFKQGVISSTKASWGGSGYSVELFPDGTWRNLWHGEIGNRYEAPGLLIELPNISENETGDLDEAFNAEEDELSQELRDKLADMLAEIAVSVIHQD